MPPHLLRLLPQWAHAEEAQLPLPFLYRIPGWMRIAIEQLSFATGRDRGRFYVEPDQYSSAISGRLWWTRWSTPEEFVTLWIETP